MKILVTGATGFIGKHVISTLLNEDQNIQVIATSIGTNRTLEVDDCDRLIYKPHVIKGKSKINLFNFFEKPDSCIHLAWEGLDDYNAKEHQTTFFENHKYFLNNLLSNGLSKLTVLGTCLEYGLQEGELNEDIKPNPSVSYAIGKNNLRIYLEKQQNKVPFEFNWLRLFYLYGKGQNPKAILEQLKQDLSSDKEVFNMSGGKQIRDYLCVKEVASIITKVAFKQHGNGVLNCCSGIPISIKELVLRYLEENNCSINLNLGYYPYPDYEPFEFWGSRKKLNKVLNTV